MRKILMKNDRMDGVRGAKAARMLFVALAAALCAGMWGCSDDVNFEWSNDRSGASVVGFVDDSLVLVGDYRRWLETIDRWNGEYLETSERGNPRLCVYNYRVQEKGPRSCDSIAEKKSSGWFYGQMTDSIVWSGSVNDNFKMWKIGEKPHQITMKVQFEDCYIDFKTSSVKQWLDGEFIVRGDHSLNANGDSCQYAVLDTVAQTLTYKRLDDGLKWIQKCDDVRAWGKDVYCLIFDKSVFNVYVLSNDEIIDSLLKDDFKLNRYANVSFIGNYLNIYQSLCSFDNGRIEWLTNFSSQGISFGDGKGNYITY